jgi:hypothetical protein
VVFYYELRYEYNNLVVVMAVAILQWKTHNTIQNHGIMLWPPQSVRSNPLSATTSSRKSIQPKTKNKPKMKLQ